MPADRVRRKSIHRFHRFRRFFFFQKEKLLPLFLHHPYVPGVRAGESMSPVLSVSAVTKTYKSGQVALHEIDLAVGKGEIFALLGPNGAGKTTLISIICGLVSMSSGRVVVDGHDIVEDDRAARAMIGLVPQEIA